MKFFGFQDGDIIRSKKGILFYTKGSSMTYATKIKVISAEKKEFEVIEIKMRIRENVD